MDLTRALKILERKKKKPVLAPAPAKPKEYLNTPVVICPNCDFEHPDSPFQSGSIGCGNCGQPFEVLIGRMATGKRVRLPTQSRDHVEYIRLFTSRQIRAKILEKKDLSDIKTAEEANAHYLAGHITAQEYKELALHNKWIFWDLSEDRNPFSPEGDNKPRERGAIYHPNKHPKGIIFQHVVKEAIRNFIDFGYGAMRALYGKDKAGRFQRWVLKRMLATAPGMIDFANRTMKTQYDKDAFVFEDPFLTALHDLAHEHIDKNFQWDYPWLPERMQKGADMALVILKEDMPYRAKAKLFINDLIARYPHGFELTPAETEANDMSNKEGEKRKRGEKFKGLKPSFIISK